MQLNFLGRQCQHPESVFGFLIKFMLSHPDAFSFACCLCPFYDCYKYFIGSYAAFQIVSLDPCILHAQINLCVSLVHHCILQVYSMKELSQIFKEPHPIDAEEILCSIPYLNIPITHTNFNIVKHSVNLSSYFEILVRTLTVEVRH